METSWVVAGENEWPGIVKALRRHCAGARKFALYGELGAGKTTLVRAFCRELGVSGDQISSPTFTLVNEYGPMPIVFHLDLYRIESEEELAEIGLEQYLDGPEYCFVEWPEVAEGWLDESFCRIDLEILLNGHRRLTLSHFPG